MKYSYTLIIFFILLSCSNNKKTLKETSSSICECFDSYTEDDSEEMIKSSKCLDSVTQVFDLNAIPKQKLIKQLNKDCPKSASFITELSSVNQYN